MPAGRVDSGWPSCPTENIRLTIRTFGSELHQERITLRPGQVLEKTIRLSGKAEEKAMRKGVLSR